MKQPEAALVDKCRKLLEKQLKPCWCVKLGDSFTRGLPDLLAVACPKRTLVVLAVECKTKKGVVSRIQQLTLSVIERIGQRCNGAVCRALVVREIGELKMFLAEMGD